ncbi:unnamed protein product [Mytilus edulis]|uniref:HAT C-terminal dimerisation domain-containing protein n=1 Tax=Mytilus edulis TaxID=6550 RepID=A0A8S3UE78_MYTED|nr:unnamed protein product [Mytilus edulis]
MSSDRCGLQRCIREQAPLAPYTRCNSHALNLVIVHACKQTDVAHTLTKMKEVCLFYKYSPKRQGLLESIIEQSVSSTNKRKPLLDLCKTRWAERHYAYSHFYDSYVFVVESLEFISYGLHKDKYDLNLYDDPWDNNTKHDAVSLLNTITEFGFIIVFMIIYQGLSALAGISVGLQRKALDVYDAFSKVDLVKSSYNSLRTNIDGRFGVWFSQATRIAERVGVTPGMPRLAAQRRPGGGMSVYRPNADLAIDCGCTITLSSLPCIHHIEDYFRQNYAIPFVDHIITELELQFSEIIAVYSEDLPSPVLVEEEYQRYKDGILRNVLDSNSVIPDSCATAIRNCDALLFPNIYTLLKLACTSPVTSAECERSASSLRRLHHYNRASMTGDRLSALALIHIHYGFNHSYEKIINSFSKLHPRNMELENIIFQK